MYELHVAPHGKHWMPTINVQGGICPCERLVIFKNLDNVRVCVFEQECHISEKFVAVKILEAGAEHVLIQIQNMQDVETYKVHRWW